MSCLFSILMIGDPHFKSENLHITTKMAAQITENIRKKKPNLVVIMGDVFDRFAHIQQRPFNIVTKWIQDIVAIVGGENVVIIVGNHDRINNKIFLTDESPFISMKQWKNPPLIVDMPIIKEYSNDGLNSDSDIRVNKDRLCLKFVFVPYVSPGRFEEALSTIKINWEEIAAVFAHQEIKGCKLSKFTVSKHGDKWSDNRPPLFLGHIHDYERLKSNVWYVGTPIQHTFADTEDKALMLLRFNDSKLETETRFKCKIEENNLYYHIDRYRLNIPLKIKLELTYKETKKFKPPSDKEISLIVKCTKSEWKKLNETGKIKSLKDSGLKVAQLLVRENTKIHVSFEKKTWTERFAEILNLDPELKTYYESLNIHIVKT